MRQACNEQRGTLTDPQLGGEQEPISARSAGAISVFKNPSSYRQVENRDPTVAAKIVLVGDLLLRKLDAV